MSRRCRSRPEQGADAIGADFSAARRYIRDAPWLSIFRVGHFLSCVALNLTGDGLRDLLDPTRNKR
jgi:ABC-type dipeptide/oligopeptide/nickel transport system permease subunit